MSRILFKEFRKKDLDFTTIEKIDGEWDDEFAQAVEDSGLSISGIVDNRTVACAGVHPIDKFHGEIWLRLGDWCLSHRIETLRWLKIGFGIIEETYPFKQIQASVRDGFCESEKILKWLGFTEVEEVFEGQTKWTIFAKRVKE